MNIGHMNRGHICYPVCRSHRISCI